MIDINGDRTVDGWEYKWDASGQQNGQFKYQKYIYKCTLEYIIYVIKY